MAIPLAEYCHLDRDPSCKHKTEYKYHYLKFVRSMLTSKGLEEATNTRIVFTEDPHNASLIVTSPGGVSPLLTSAHDRALFLLVEFLDDASVGTPRGIVDSARTAAVFKHYKLFNSFGRCHGQKPIRLLLGALMEGSVSLPPGPMTHADYDSVLTLLGCNISIDSVKVEPVIPPWLTVHGGSRFPMPEHMPSIAERTVDIAFAGKLHKGAIGWHRRGGMERLAQLGKRHGLRVVSTETLPQEKYRSLILRTKLFVSPWGNGEWSIKDEEVVLSGAVLAKPGASLLRSIWTVYSPETCLELRPDWADLEAVLLAALADEQRLQDMQRAARSALQPFVGKSALREERVLNAFGRVVAQAAQREEHVLNDFGR